jgi:phenylacetate-CoA ligase
MKFDFSRLPFRSRAFSEKPMAFIDSEPKQFLSAIIDVIAIETGKRKARENWQKAQLRRLLKHAHERSPFWRKRIGTRKTSDVNLFDLPVLTRSDVVHQVKSEGSLLRPADGLGVTAHSTSGSSGTPVRFFISHMNSDYSQVRSLAQYLMEGRDLGRNRTRLRSSSYEEGERLQSHATNSFTVEVTETWLGPLSILFQSGTNKHINYWKLNRYLLFKELLRHPIGYLLSPPSFLEALFQTDYQEFIERAKIELIVPIGGQISGELHKLFGTKQIPVRGAYSSEEVSLIGSECEHYRDHYHVAHSNVIVEVDDSNGVSVGGNTLHRILVTHLHSYATPFIRYDIGDFGVLADGCKCGHDGFTIINVLGGGKNLLKHPNGELTPFYIRAKDLYRVAQFDEYRIRQTALNTVVVEMSGCRSLAEDKHGSLIKLINHAGDHFDVEVKLVDKIDWERSAKRLGLRNELI